MAADSTNPISYFVAVEASYQEHIGNIRDWENLKMGREGQLIWLTGFTEQQIKAIALQTIPNKKVYYAQGVKLFEQGSLLPSCNIPSLLWTPISRSLPVRLPDFNHNYFGVDSNITIRLKQTDQEQEAMALLATLTDLKTYIATAPAIRLTPLKWVIINQKKALILGKPLLPIQGEAYWLNQDSLLPLGYDFDLSIMADAIHKALNPNRNNWLFWNTNSNYTNIAKELFQPLSISSFRKTTKP